MVVRGEMALWGWQVKGLKNYHKILYSVQSWRVISRDQQPFTCTWLYKPSVVQSICDTLLLRAVSAVLLLLKCLVSLFWQRPQGGRSPVEHTGTSICPSERADFRPERAWGGVGRTDRQADRQMKVAMCSTGLRPLLGPPHCPASSLSN